MFDEFKPTPQQAQAIDKTNAFLSQEEENFFGSPVLMVISFSYQRSKLINVNGSFQSL